MNFTRHDLPIRRLASGAQLSIPVFHFAGNPGKKVYIQANIHGPEIAGIGAIYDLMRILNEQATINGSIIIVPSVNPVGLDSKVSGLQTGYADLNETVVGNFNRIYQLLVTEKPNQTDSPAKVYLKDFVEHHYDSEVEAIVAAFRAALMDALAALKAHHSVTGMRHGLKLAFTIQEMAQDADLLIDLHTAGRAIYHNFAFEKCFPSGRYFGIPYFITLDDSFSGVLDEAFLLPWLKLQAAFREQGRDIAFARLDKEAFTLELGSADTLDAAAMDIDAKRIVNYLRFHGVLEGEAQLPPIPFYASTQDHYQRYYAPTGGLVLWHKAPGDQVQQGEQMATLLCTYELGRGETLIPILADRDGILINHLESQVVHEGMNLCSIATYVEQVKF